jgi:multicomponent Na+:H+ antiporter subunit B
MKKVIALIVIIVALVVPFAKLDILPQIGDPDSAPNSHVSPYYIENAIDETNAPNMVTAVIVDFRAFDTMYETTVMFLAGVGAVLILASRPAPQRRIIIPTRYYGHRYKLGDPNFRTINKDVMVTLLEPLIMIYAMYVLFHGEISLGGGFQAGALLGLAYIIDVMVIPERRNLFLLPKRNSVALAGAGTFIYTLTGILTLFGGGNFMDFSHLPFSMSVAEKHSTGILMVEIGVTICVMATIVTILNAIMERVRFDDDRY